MKEFADRVVTIDVFNAKPNEKDAGYQKSCIKLTLDLEDNSRKMSEKMRKENFKEFQNIWP